MIELYAINYDNPNRQDSPVGGIAKQFVAGRDDYTKLPASYADTRAMHQIWRHDKHLEIIGFHGYRKHIDFLAAANARRECSLEAFRGYQKWLTVWDGQKIRELLNDHGIIVTVPYWFTNGENMTTDFRRSRSSQDWDVYMEVMSQYGAFNFDLPYIHDMFFVTHGTTFQWYMKFWDIIMKNLEGRVKSEDATDAAYLARTMAYLSQYTFSLWLNANLEELRPVELSLLTCWDVH